MANDYMAEVAPLSTHNRASLPAFFFMALSLLAGCINQTVLMIHPQTGATAECSGSSYGFGPLFSENVSDSCARVYKDRGFVPLERLTAEDRDSLEPRGLLLK
jgi:hypothetical protein